MTLIIMFLQTLQLLSIFQSKLEEPGDESAPNMLNDSEDDDEESDSSSWLVSLRYVVLRA